MRLINSKVQGIEARIINLDAVALYRRTRNLRLDDYDSQK